MLRCYGLWLLLFFALADLGSTLYWYGAGMMTELNPIMRPLLESSTASFTVVKLATLAALAVAVGLYYRRNPEFCNKACSLGAIGYVSLWTGWTCIGNLV